MSVARSTPRPVLELLGRAVMDKNRAQREARQRQAELDQARELIAELRERLERAA